MTEQLLQYLWNFKIFNNRDFKDTQGFSVEILDFGKWNHNSGPDFLFATIKSRGFIFSGHIELHLQSSDWDLHQHSKDTAYHNVILHVVYHHNKNIDFLEEKNIPTLELKHHIDADILQKYDLLSTQNQFIPCEKLITQKHIPIDFHQENIIKKLEEKSIIIQEQFLRNKSDLEATLFSIIAYGFGLKINAQIFQAIAENIDFSIIRKISKNPSQLETLLLGKAGYLKDPQDEQSLIWNREYDFIIKKYSLNTLIFQPQFLRLRPANFPTIRLSQLSQLYSQNQNLFSKIIESKTYSELKQIFENITASDYWDCHYQIGKISAKRSKKKLSKDFIDLLILNVILPFKYFYFKYKNENIIDEILSIYEEIAPEKNNIVQEWKNLKINIMHSLESQSLLYHYKNQCLEKKCLNCNIGLRILKS